MRRVAVALALLGGLFGLMVGRVGCSGRAAVDGGLRLTGEHLWRGERPLVARIAGHTSPLPPQATRCINCHGPSETHRREEPTPVTGAIPVLTAAHLRQTASRRGGPPSRYDAATFCRVLRSGVDPAAVLLPRAMPRYEIGEADCAALWQYLTLTSKDTRS